MADRERCPRCGREFKPLTPRVKAKDIADRQKLAAREPNLSRHMDQRGPAGTRGHKCEPPPAPRHSAPDQGLCFRRERKVVRNQAGEVVGYQCLGCDRAWGLS